MSIKRHLTDSMELTQEDLEWIAGSEDCEPRDCLAPEWCGLACNEFCDNCQEDIDYAHRCERGLFLTN